ncbi:B12-binding domain-containing protein [Streptomyces sp. NPDC047706]|uniref:B12-binding domain-containing protein n=1 Tax=Streptomyces sp. NPDC047706 TaxID=3365486 RepID=UPI0037194C65
MSTHITGTTAEGTGRHSVGARPVSPYGDRRAVPWADKLWVAVRAADEYSAVDVVADALAAGLDAEAVLLDVIGAVQHKVGIEWAANRMSVADEHAATAINDRVIATLPTRRPATSRGRITVACVDQEWHALPARLLELTGTYEYLTTPRQADPPQGNRPS